MAAACRSPSRELFLSCTAAYLMLFSLGHATAVTARGTGPSRECSASRAPFCLSPALFVPLVRHELLALPALWSAVRLSPHVPNTWHRFLCLHSSECLWLVKPYCIPVQLASSSPCAFCTGPDVPDEGQRDPGQEALTELEHHLCLAAVCLHLWHGARQCKAEQAACKIQGQWLK